MKTILLLGGAGQVGWELRRSLSTSGNVLAPRRSDLDLLDATKLRAMVRATRPDVVVNAGAQTDVDRAESEPDLAWAINATMPGVLAQSCVDIGASLVHFSTDHVFDGSGAGRWRESDPTGPLNHYGRSKLAGEANVRATGVRHLIVRCSWVHSPRRRNFVRSILDRVRDPRHPASSAIEVVDDQHGSPTGADLVADVTTIAIRSMLPAMAPGAGITWHLAASGETTRHRFAQFIVATAAKHDRRLAGAVGRVVPIRSGERPAPAIRPLNARLDTTRICTDLGIELPHWMAGVERTVVELMEP